jgi:D-alanyl-lipoteichoic acid acyltransferase DltB (MBOAT superfamily)
MLFNSFPYIFLFLPIVVVLTLLARRVGGPKAAQAVVLVASLFFYTWWKPIHLPYLLGSIAANWLIAKRIDTSTDEDRKRWLQFGLVANVLFLSIFKYVNFFLKSFHQLIPQRFLLPDLDFPLGVSFFTISQIMYLVDCYETILPASSLFDHATFVSFFPYVISGPIAKAKRILHQAPNFGGSGTLGTDLMARGIYLFSLGLFKKVVFADAFARVSDYGVASVSNPSTLESWVFSIAYSMQVYFDFSGYSDMAIGSALMLGIEIPQNFNAPFKALTLIKYWQRWHISLTNFITTYLYTPILQSFPKATLSAAAVATILAMSIAGLWHGPAWTYVWWGVYHGIGLAINQYWNKKKILKLPAAVSWVLTFSFVNGSFVLFHARTVSEAVRGLIGLFPRHNLLGTTNLNMMTQHAIIMHILGPPLLVGFVIAFLGKSSEERAREFKPTVFHSATAVVLLLAAWIFLNSSIATPFVYFQF